MQKSNNNTTPTPISYSQEGLWILDQTKGSLNYHIPLVFEYKGILRFDRLEYALKVILERHTTLRTVFKQDVNGNISQEILTIDDWCVFYETKTSILTDKGLEDYVNELSEKPFNLKEDYMLKAHLLESDTSYLILIFHHIAFDGWSESLFLEELQLIYNLYENPHIDQTTLNSISYKYSDYAKWQRSIENEAILNNKLEFWKDYLNEYTPLNFPTNFQRPTIQSYKGGNHVLELPKWFEAELTQLAKKYRATPFMILFTIYTILLYKYTGQKDVIVGCPTANRTNPQSRDLIGHFVNSLPLRTIFTKNITFPELLDQVKTNFIKVYEYQDVPFEKITRALLSEQDRSRSPLFQMMFIMQSNRRVPSIILGDTVLEKKLFKGKTSKYDMTFSITSKDNSLEVLIEYCNELFEPEMIEQIGNHYKILAKSVMDHPETKIDDLLMLSEKEQYKLLVKFNDTDMKYPTEISVIDQFKEKCSQFPNMSVVLFGERKMTYRELDQKSDQVASFLHEIGTQSGEIIGICMSRSFDMIIVILGIWKTGASYVALDAAYPEKRINYIIKDSGTKTVICSDTILLNVGLKDIVTFKINEVLSKQKTNHTSIWQPHIVSTQLAYVIYTSGSTGKPKGVMITHSNLNSFINWSKKEFNEDPFNIVYAVTSLCFDLSIFEIIYPLCAGKQIRILENGLSISEYVQLDEQILLNTVPSVIASLQENNVNLINVRLINMAGEPIPEKVLKQIEYDTNIVRNLYGPSEDTTYSTCFRLRRGDKSLIGKPIGNTKAYVLDENLNILPLGVIGELCLSGEGVALGYLNLEQLTKEKFITNPFEKDSNYKLYRTGDLVKWQPDGTLEFIGRKDSQVKIRGFRIELGEIEAVLSDIECVEHGIISAHVDGFGEKRIIAYVVSQEEDWQQKVNIHMNSKLPDYMIPSTFIKIDKIPVNNNGKIDRKRLPKPDFESYKPSEYCAPTTPIEKKLTALWEEVLEQTKIGVNDSLFELGGHSLTAAKIVAIVNNKFSTNLKVNLLFELQTIHKLSKYLEVLLLNLEEEETYDIIEI